jgi:hypothetical protein
MSGSGGLMQLVAYGAQDVYLTANPQVTFFKQLYRRHSNFAMESIEQTFNGVASFGKRVQCTIARNGDLISKVYLQATLPAVNYTDVSAFEWVPFVGQYLIKSVEIEIGGQQIDKHYGDWLHIWNELTLPCGKKLDYLKMVSEHGGVNLVNGTACDDCDDNSKTCASINLDLAAKGTDALLCGNGLTDDAEGCIPEHTLYIPLEFWFNRHYGLALPLIALQYHEVKINVDFNDLKYLCNIPADAGGKAKALRDLNAAGLVSCSLWVDYIFLDTEERRRFAQVAHEYLIEQLQFTGDQSLTTTNNRVILSLNHPVKELIWVVQDPSYLDCDSEVNQPWNYATAVEYANPTKMAKLQLNGHDRFEEREGKYFNVVQPFQHHSNSPQTGINVYSFAIRPEDIQPSGSCNFSRIDNAVLNLTLSSDAATTNLLKVYAVNYNVLRIMAGMGGLAYSN